MKFKFISNACGIFTSKSGKTILCDPWIDDGVFEGSWCHFHELKTTFEDLKDVDSLYISHIHPDHFDIRNFNYRKDIPIFVLDHGFNFLQKNLEKMGYTNLIKIKDGETTGFEDFKVTLFAPFVTHSHYEQLAVVGNLIDSGMVVESNGIVAFNPNDNTPDINACKMINNRFGNVDIALMNYNAAGPYPSCFQNLSEDEKVNEHNRILMRNFQYLTNNCHELKPKAVLPFAGAYVLGGKLSYKNDYLGTTTWDECANYLSKNLTTETKIICLRENDEINLEDKKINNPYVPIDAIEVKNYIKEKLSNLKYDYELDKGVDEEILITDLKEASKKMFNRCEKVSLIPDMDVEIVIGENIINVCKANNSKGNMTCSLDQRLLRRILDRSAHWNNAEIGCHIEFNRKPNYYSPDMHVMLQFLHL